MERTFPVLVAARSLGDAEDPAAIIRGRVDRWGQTSGLARRAGTDLIAGLIQRAIGVTDPDMARALEERDESMQRRARALAEQAIEQNQVWVRRLGVPPSDPLAREQWTQAVTTVAAYRERRNIDDDQRPLGSTVAARTIEAINQRDLAQTAVNTAARLTSPAGPRRPDLGPVADISPVGGPAL